MGLKKTLATVSVAAALLVAQCSAAGSPCVAYAGPGSARAPAAVGFAAALGAEAGACAERPTGVVAGVVGDAAYAAARAAFPEAVIVGPQTESAAARGYDGRVFYTGTDPVSEVVGALAHVQPTHVAVMQVAGAGMDAIPAVAREASGNPAAVYTAPSGNSAAIDEAQYAAIVASRPDTIIVAGPSGAHATAFFRRIVQERSVVSGGAVVVAPSALQVSLLKAYAEAVAAAGASAVVSPSRIVFTSTTPLANDARFDAVAAFHAEAGAATAHYNVAEQTAALAGWVAAKVSQQIVARYGTDADAVARGMAGQNRFLVNDLVIGDFAGPCGKGIRGVACSCNQAGRTVYVSTAAIDDAGAVTLRSLPEADYTYPMSACFATDAVTVAVAAEEGKVVLAFAEGEGSTDGDTTEAPHNVPIDCSADEALLIICIVFSIVIVVVTAALWGLSRVFPKEFNACYDCIEDHNPVDVIMRFCPSWCG